MTRLEFDKIIEEFNLNDKIANSKCYYDKSNRIKVREKMYHYRDKDLWIYFDSNENACVYSSNKTLLDVMKYMYEFYEIKVQKLYTEKIDINVKGYKIKKPIDFLVFLSVYNDYVKDNKHYNYGENTIFHYENVISKMLREIKATISTEDWMKGVSTPKSLTFRNTLCYEKTSSDNFKVELRNKIEEFDNAINPFMNNEARINTFSKNIYSRTVKNRKITVEDFNTELMNIPSPKEIKNIRKGCSKFKITAESKNQYFEENGYPILIDYISCKRTGDGFEYKLHFNVEHTKFTVKHSFENKGEIITLKYVDADKEIAIINKKRAEKEQKIFDTSKNILESQEKSNNKLLSFLHKKNTPEKDISNYTNEEKSKDFKINRKNYQKKLLIKYNLTTGRMKINEKEDFIPDSGQKEFICNQMDKAIEYASLIALDEIKEYEDTTCKVLTKIPKK